MLTAGLDRKQYDRLLRDTLAGVSETTPLELFLMLEGQMEEFTDDAKAMMEWDLRYLGYVEKEVSPICMGPKHFIWVRKAQWPEDLPWLADDEDGLLDAVEAMLAREAGY